MKKSIFIFCFSLIALFGKSQRWEPVDAGINNSTRNVDAESDPVKALCEYHGKLYIGGNFTYSGKRKINNLACWDDKKIDTVGVGIDGTVFALLAYGKKLCIGGRFVKAAPNHTFGRGIILWRDTIDSWTAIDNAFSSLPNRIYSLFIYKGELYAGGFFSYKSANCIAKWSGSSWNKVKNSMNSSEFPKEGAIESVEAMTQYNGKLYAGGEFYITDPDYTHGIACWDGEKWNEVGKIKCPGDVPKASSYPDNGVITMKVYKQYLYVGGNFDSVAGKRLKRLARWNDTSWSGIGNVHGFIYTMLVYNNKLYVGGEFDSIAGEPLTNIACWDGKSWSAVGDGLEAFNHNLFKGRVDALAVYKGELYAGGYFNSSGKIALNNLARINLKTKIVGKKR